MRAGRAGLLPGSFRTAALFLAAACAATSAAPDRLVEGCAWEARWDADPSARNARARACVERHRTSPPEPGWRPGPASRDADPGECLERAWSGVLRFRACMAAAGYRELEAGSIPYRRSGTGARTTAIDARSCAERSFSDTRYGRFAGELEWCLLRRSWRPAAGP